MKGPSELQIQKSFFEWLKNYKYINDRTFAIPNGGTRNIIEAVNLVKSGVKKGVLDVFVRIPASVYHGLWIEFKSKDGKLTKEQREFMLSAIDEGYDACVCRSLEEAIQVLKNYLGEDLRSVGATGKTLDVGYYEIPGDMVTAIGNGDNEKGVKMLNKLRDELSKTSGKRKYN